MNESLITEQLEPFGLVVAAVAEGTDLRDESPAKITKLVEKNRVVVFRGFAPLMGEEFPAFCASFGEVLEFDFGVVNELKTTPGAKNYLYTNREVPFHWDGAFIGRIPSFIFFQCDEAPASDTGGETLFTDTTLMLGLATPDLAAKWRGMNITYSTDKIVHYGGSFLSPVVTRNAAGNNDVIRYAEPVAELNPVRLDIEGIPADECALFVLDMHERLNDDAVCYRHKWQGGDILIADNNTLLHGRRAFSSGAKRRIRRVNVL